MARKMTATARSKPEKVVVGTSTVNASDMQGLRNAWAGKHLVFFLGAGVSLPYGLPTWKNLVLELLFEQAANTKRLGQMWPHYRRALASWMTDYFGYDPMVLARMVERDMRAKSRRKSQADGLDAREQDFLEKLRQRLYASFNPQPSADTALRAISRLVAKSGDTHGVAAAVTFNYDDLLEQDLKQRGVEVLPVVDGTRQHGPGFRVVHPHGYVPQAGEVKRHDLVFTEDDYHRLTESPFHWGLTEIVSYLRNNTVVFVGLSMSDPSLRRLLDASRNSQIPAHWQIQKRHAVSGSGMLDVLQDVARRAREQGAMLGRTDEHKDTNELQTAVSDALRQADTYDREVFQTMGVKTIWIDDWAALPALIDAIAL